MVGVRFTGLDPRKTQQQLQDVPNSGTVIYRGQQPNVTITDGSSKPFDKINFFVVSNGARRGWHNTMERFLLDFGATSCKQMNPSVHYVVLDLPHPNTLNMTCSCISSTTKTTRSGSYDSGYGGEGDADDVRGHLGPRLFDKLIHHKSMTEDEAVRWFAQRVPGTEDKRDAAYRHVRVLRGQWLGLCWRWGRVLDENFNFGGWEVKATNKRWEITRPDPAGDKAMLEELMERDKGLRYIRCPDGQKPGEPLDPFVAQPYKPLQPTYPSPIDVAQAEVAAKRNALAESLARLNALKNDSADVTSRLAGETPKRISGRQPRRTSPLLPPPPPLPAPPFKLRFSAKPTPPSVSAETTVTSVSPTRRVATVPRSSSGELHNFGGSEAPGRPPSATDTKSAEAADPAGLSISPRSADTMHTPTTPAVPPPAHSKFVSCPSAFGLRRARSLPSATLPAPADPVPPQDNETPLDIEPSSTSASRDPEPKQEASESNSADTPRPSVLPSRAQSVPVLSSSVIAPLDVGPSTPDLEVIIISDTEDTPDTPTTIASSTSTSSHSATSPLVRRPPKRKAPAYALPPQAHKRRVLSHSVTEGSMRPTRLGAEELKSSLGWNCDSIEPIPLGQKDPNRIKNMIGLEEVKRRAALVEETIKDGTRKRRVGTRERSALQIGSEGPDVEPAEGSVGVLDGPEMEEVEEIDLTKMAPSVKSLAPFIIPELQPFPLEHSDFE